MAGDVRRLSWVVLGLIQVFMETLVPLKGLTVTGRKAQPPSSAANRRSERTRPEEDGLI